MILCHFLHILSKEFRAEVQKMRVIKRKLGNFNLYPHKLHNTAFRPLDFALTYHFLCIVIYNQSYLQHTYQNLLNGAKFEGNQIIVDIDGKGHMFINHGFTCNAENLNLVCMITILVIQIP